MCCLNVWPSASLQLYIVAHCDKQLHAPGLKHVFICHQTVLPVLRLVCCHGLRKNVCLLQLCCMIWTRFTAVCICDGVKMESSGKRQKKV